MRCSLEAPEPAIYQGQLAVVDGRLVCTACGRPLRQTWAGTWRHAPRANPAADRQATRPGTSHEDVGSSEWQEARRRLARYWALLRRARRRRRLAPGSNIELELVCALVQPAHQPLRHDLGGAMTQLPAWGLPAGLVSALELPARRRELASLFAWSVPTEHALAVLARYAPLVETGAGMAYWAALLRQRGVDVAAYDAAPPGIAANEYHTSGHEPWTEVQQATALAAVRAHPQRTLLLGWPPYDDDSASYVPLRATRAETFAFAGQPDEGAAGSIRFHRELALNWTQVDLVPLPSWPGIPDSLTVYRRNRQRRPHTLRDRCPECGRMVRTGSIGRCDDCVTRRPPTLALQVGRHRLEYNAEQLAEMPVGLRLALQGSPNRIG